MASTTEPEGWDAAHVLQLANPATARWSCPTLTRRNRRCENDVDQQPSEKAALLLDMMSVEDPSVVARDHRKELTYLAEVMLCPLHSGGSDSEEKVKAVVAQWRGIIRTWTRRKSQMAQRAQPQLQPGSSITAGPGSPSLPGRQSLKSLPEKTARVHQTQTRARPPTTTTTSSSSSSSSPVIIPPQPQAPPPPRSHGATATATAAGQAPAGDDPGALEGLAARYDRLRDRNRALRERNERLRGENARLAEQRDAAAREHRRAAGELGAAEAERDALGARAREQLGEIGALRDREAAHLRQISRMREALDRTAGAYSRMREIWRAPSVGPGNMG